MKESKNEIKPGTGLFYGWYCIAGKVSKAEHYRGRSKALCKQELKRHYEHYEEKEECEIKDNLLLEEYFKYRRCL